MARPTNTDLYNKLESSSVDLHTALKRQKRELSDAIGAVGKIAIQTQRDVRNLQDWRLSVEAVEKYKEYNQKTDNSWLNKELIKIIGIALGLVASLIAMIRSGQ